MDVVGSGSWSVVPSDLGGDGRRNSSMYHHAQPKKRRHRTDPLLLAKDTAGSFIL